MKRMNGMKKILAFTTALSISVPAAMNFTSSAEYIAQAEKLSSNYGIDGRGNAIRFVFNNSAVIDLNGAFINSEKTELVILFDVGSEGAELTVTDSSEEASGKMFADSISSTSGSLYINAGTFKGDIGFSLSSSGKTEITGGRFIFESPSGLFDKSYLDGLIPLGYEAIAVDPIDGTETYEVRKADTDIISSEQLYEPILSPINERLENGFTNYSEVDTTSKRCIHRAAGRNNAVQRYVVSSVRKLYS